MSSRDHGPLRSARSVRRARRSGVPTAPAMCSGPVSPDTISCAPLAMREDVDDAGRRTQFGGAARRADDDVERDVFLARSPRARATAHRCRSRIAAASAPNRSRRPALVRPRGAGIDQRIALRSKARGHRVASTGLRHFERKRDAAVARRRAARISARFLWMTCGSRAGIGRFACRRRAPAARAGAHAGSRSRALRLPVAQAPPT